MRRSYWTSVTAGVLVMTSSGAADPSPLAQVAASAAMVMHFNGPDAVEAHVSDFLKAAVPEQAAAAKAGIEAMFQGSAFGGGRKVAGLARDGHLFTVFLDAKLSGPTPSMAVLLPLPQYAYFRQT